MWYGTWSRSSRRWLLRSTQRRGIRGASGRTAPPSTATSTFSCVEISEHAANYFRFRLGPEVEIALGAEILASGDKPAGARESVELFACRDRHGMIEPYDRLLSDAMEGEGREDAVLSASAVER